MTEQQEVNKRWIGVAACDWMSSSLMSRFYPEDVPQDWYLTWYANFAMAVVLPSARWQKASPLDVSEWLDQTQENFWFYLQCETDEQVSQALTLVALFEGRFGGLILPQALAHLEIKLPVAVLYLGKEVLLYRAKTLREGRNQIMTWLEGDFVAQHGLILLDDAIAYQIKDVQTMLVLIGENSGQ